MLLWKSLKQCLFLKGLLKKAMASQSGGHGQTGGGQGGKEREHRLKGTKTLLKISVEVQTHPPHFLTKMFVCRELWER